MKRVIVIGSSAAGKSTLAREIAQRLGVSHIELDELNWGPNWTQRSGEEFDILLAQRIQGDSWVVDGNYGIGKNRAWQQTTTIVWLDYNFPTVFWRGLRRTISRGISRQELWNGNRESLRMAFFSRDSILLWIIMTFHQRRRTIRALRQSEAFRDLEWIEVRTRGDSRRGIRREGFEERDSRRGIRREGF